MSVDPALERWFAKRQHPQEAAMRAVRDAIMASDPRVTEAIKWQSPTFIYRGNIASINPQAKAYVSLMFHRGAQISGDHPELQGGGETTRYMRFDSVEDVAAKRPALEAVIRAWCADRDRDA